MPTLQDLLNAIPDVNDGDVIIADCIRAPKNLLAALVAQAGTSTSTTKSLTLQANFLPNQKATPWTIGIGFAQDAAGSDGWIPLFLPDGAIIQQLVAVGGRVASAGFVGFVSLVIVPIAGGNPTTLILIDLSSAGNPFQLTGIPSVAGASPQTLTDLQTVKNSDNKYLIHAQTVSTTAATTTINAVRLIYATP